MKAKRILAGILVTALAALSLAGCSGSSGSESSAETSPAESSVAEDAATDDAAADDTAEDAAPADAGTTDFEGTELVIATWGWTAANVQELSKGFEEQYNCKILIDETSGNADRLNKVQAQKNAPQIDLVMMSESFAVIGNNEGLFEKIDTSVVTNLDNLYDFAKNADGYGPCYSVVRYGIIYDADQVTEAPTSYNDLFSGKYDSMLSLPDMASTAGPYLLVALAEANGGSQENVDPAFEILAKNKDNIAQFYSASSDVQTGFTTGEIGVTVFMDMNVPTLKDAGVNAVWVEPAEGCFSAAATINVVKDCPNPELAQLYVNYLLSDEVQNQVADKLSEAPTSKNATMSDDKKEYLAFGEDAVSNLRVFDWNYIDSQKESWIDRFQREVAI